LSTSSLRPPPPRTATRKDGPPVELSRSKKLLFTCAMLVLCFGGLELTARLYLAAFQGFDGKHLLQYEFDPYKNILPTRNYVDTRGVIHNSDGFRRSTEVPLAKPAGTYRIFLMGASAAYGTGGLWPHIQREYAVLKNEETIDAYLEGYLTEQFPTARFEVINAAIPSAWTHHELIYLNQKILKYEPDMVLFLDGFNDFFHTDPGHDQFSAYAYGEHAHVIMGPPTVQALATANLWWLSRKSAFVHLAVRGARNGKMVLDSILSSEVRTPIDVDRNLANLRQVFPRNALAMVRRSTVLLNSEGVAAVFILQPMLITERERTTMPDIERQLFEFNVNSYLPGYEDFIRQALPWLRDTTRAEVEKAGGQFIDGTRPFDMADTEQIFTDYVHLTPYGNRRLADYIGERLVERIREDLANSGDS
jgi:lysophospholipase L1-like esterase